MKRDPNNDDFNVSPDDDTVDNSDFEKMENLEKLLQTWWPPVVAFVLMIGAIWGWYDARNDDLLICRGQPECHQAKLVREYEMAALIVAGFVAFVVLLLTVWRTYWPPEEDQ